MSCQIKYEKKKCRLTKREGGSYQEIHLPTASFSTDVIENMASGGVQSEMVITLRDARGGFMVLCENDKQKIICEGEALVSDKSLLDCLCEWREKCNELTALSDALCTCIADALQDLTVNTTDPQIETNGYTQLCLKDDEDNVIGTYLVFGVYDEDTEISTTQIIPLAGADPNVTIDQLEWCGTLPASGRNDLDGVITVIGPDGTPQVSMPDGFAACTAMVKYRKGCDSDVVRVCATFTGGGCKCFLLTLTEANKFDLGADGDIVAITYDFVDPAEAAIGSTQIKNLTPIKSVDENGKTCLETIYLYSNV